VSDIPAISGNQLIALLQKDGWTLAGQRTHGVALKKADDSGRVRVALIKPTSKSLPEQTLGGILSVKQSGIGRKGLRELIEKYGL